MCLAQDFVIIHKKSKGGYDVSRTAYKNRYIKEHYDRINFAIPKGEKDKIKATAARMGVSINEYLFMLVCADIVTGQSRMVERKQGFSEKQKAMLDKWQVARKYHEMIEDVSYSKEEGYFIYLKDGYINDVTNNRSIYCEKIAELRRIIVYTHKKC